MFLKNLKITMQGKIIRDIKFHQGLNLIVDETLVTNEQLTGNNVGKTTVLKLVDFCLGADRNIIYTDPENKKKEYAKVRDFLVDNKILITIILIGSLNDTNKEKIIIERNFLKGKDAVRKINGKQEKDKDFEAKLKELIMLESKLEKPSFRQIISHNIRYKDENINNTLKILSNFTTDTEYETLYLYMLGCNFNEGDKKQEIIEKIKQEKTYKDRLEKNQTKNAYEIALSMIEEDIKRLNYKKSKFNINENFERDLQELNKIKYKINKISSNISKLNIRRDLIEEAKNELTQNVANIDLKQLEIIYSQAKHNIKGIQKTFEDLVKFHNNMVYEKIRFITQDLPNLNNEIQQENIILKKQLIKEKEITLKVSKGDSFKELEKIIEELNDKYRSKGEMESTITKINETENNLNKYYCELREIEEILFSNDFEEKLKLQIKKFNKYFSSVSEELYGERYALKHEIIINKKTAEKIFKFDSFNANLSSGKKQGEILCFDIAYTLFADEEDISCLHFLLNDKKELMHGNQLIKVSEFIKNKNIQLVISILKDKLPKELDTEDNIILRLSQDDKLFRIENIES